MKTYPLSGHCSKQNEKKAGRKEEKKVSGKEGEMSSYSKGT